MPMYHVSLKHLEVDAVFTTLSAACYYLYLHKKYVTTEFIQLKQKLFSF